MTIIEHMGTVYGPVPSWRLGRSIGIDLISREEKTCSFDCIYCQLGKTKHMTTERKVFVPTEEVIEDLKKVLKKTEADVITFSGTGEPTLASNLGEVANRIHEISDLPLAILTNSSLIWRPDMREDLKKLDIVCAKLEAPNEEVFKIINSPAQEVTLEKVIGGIKKFREEYTGKLALQIMFIKQNQDYAKEIANIAREIEPNEIQLDTPLRPCAVKPLDQKEIRRIEREFSGMKNVKSVYDFEKPKVDVVDLKKTRRRRPEL